MLQVSPSSTLAEFPVPREVILGVEQLIRGAITDGLGVELKDEIPLDHQFIPGAYARGMRVAAGTLLVGKIHRKPCFNFILAGKCVVFDEGGRKDISAPVFFVSPPGIKRVIFAVEDLIWYNVHGTDQTDPALLELELIAPSYASLEDSQLIEGTV